MIRVTRIETTVEGDADQLPAILAQLRMQVSTDNTAAEHAHEANHLEPEVTAEMVRKLLTYRPLHEKQKALLAALYQSDDFVSATDISAEIGIDRRQLTGVMGGIGLRAKAIRGWPRKDRARGLIPTRFLWDHDRRSDGDYYRATPMLRQAIKALAIVNGR